MIINSNSFINRAIRSLLWRTGVGRKVAEWFWHIRDNGPGYEVLYYHEEDVFDNIPTSFDSDLFNAYVKADNARYMRQSQFVVRIEDVLLEPERLLGIRAGREVVDQTVVYKGDRQYPYILNFLLKRGKRTMLPEAILYDGSATRNYYHHFVDALSQLTILPSSKIPAHLPLLITRAMFENTFFQYLYKRSSYFKNQNWYVVEPNEWIEVKNLYKVRALVWAPTTWKQMRLMYELPDKRPFRKVFLNRDRNLVGRYLTNEKEIEEMLRRHGFETVFAERLSMEEQTQLFQETEYLVALHGAGLIQQFFMNPNYGHIIEVMPANRLMPLYLWQAVKIGVRYFDVVIGDSLTGTDDKDYFLDTEKLESAVKRMLTNTSLRPVYGHTIIKS